MKKTQTYAEKKWGNCDDAVAYALNFVQMCYTSDFTSNFYKCSCDSCHHLVQINDLQYSKGNFSKKDYFILDFLCYGVSEELKNDMIFLGVGSECFRAIWDKEKTSILGYQLIIDKTLPPTYQENGMYELEKCSVCGHRQFECYDKLMGPKAYNGLGYPIYMNRESFNKLDLIGCLYENNNDVIISLYLYNKLLQKYPRIECRPVFIGSIYNDEEFLRLTQTINQ